MNPDMMQIYRERAIAAVLAAKMALHAGFAAGVGRDMSNPQEPEEWRVVLFIDLPGGGQVSWHISPNDQDLLRGLPRYEKPWDGTSEGQTGDKIRKMETP